MWKPSRAQWIVLAVGLVPTAVFCFSGVSAVLSGDRQVLWPVPVLVGAVIALLTALTVSWLEAKK